MKKLHYLFIFCFVFCWEATFAQQELAIIPKDTIKRVIDPNAPAKAAFYSALVPGLGQAYNKKYWKMPIVYLGLGISVGTYLDQNKKYNEYRDEYKRRLDGTANPSSQLASFDNDRLIRGQRFHQRNRDLAVLVTAGIYILNIIDANVDAHLLQFNVNDNLSVSPDIYHNQMNNRFNTGLKLTYEF